MSNFPACLAFTLQSEGGYSDNPNDSGGCTMQGVTLVVYQTFKSDTNLACSDLQQITSDDVAAIYQQNYWDRVQGDSLPVGVDLMVFDMSVNGGVGGSGKILQECLGVTADGDIGPETVAAVANIDPTTLVNSLAERQSDYYKSLPSFQYFGQGWLNRVAARQNAALSMMATS